MGKAGHTWNRDRFPPRTREQEADIVNDEEIIELFFMRAETAITYTQEKYGALCRTVANRILADERDVEECVSDVYLRVWDAIPPERPRSLRAYLARIARNLALDRYSYNKAAQRDTALTDAWEELEPWLPSFAGDADSAMERQYFRQALNDFLREQSKEARTFFLRRYWYGESNREIAESCHVSEGKVRTSLFRTRERLRDAMEKKGVQI